MESAALIYSSKPHQHLPAGRVSQGKGVTTQDSEGDQEGVELGEKLPPLLRAKDPCPPIEGQTGFAFPDSAAPTLRMSYPLGEEGGGVQQ